MKTDAGVHVPPNYDTFPTNPEIEKRCPKCHPPMKPSPPAKTSEMLYLEYLQSLGGQPPSVANWMGYQANLAGRKR